MSFIPANESAFFIWFFDHYTRWSLKRRFKQVWVSQDYQPSAKSRTVYFLNHNLWWDGLIPLYLNRHFFHQQARALMEDKQMRQYTFFSKIGAFSVNLQNPKSSIKSLRYAVESLKRPNASLFIYPEGTIKSPSEKKPVFKKGLAWIYQQTTGVDFVPVAIYSQHLRSSKPELYLSIGSSCNPDKSLAKSELNDFLENKLHQLLLNCRDTAGFDDEGFEPQF